MGQKRRVVGQKRRAAGVRKKGLWVRKEGLRVRKDVLWVRKEGRGGQKKRDCESIGSHGQHRHSDEEERGRRRKNLFPLGRACPGCMRSRNTDSTVIVG